jgi:hypothetical protein
MEEAPSGGGGSPSEQYFFFSFLDPKNGRRGIVSDRKNVEEASFADFLRHGERSGVSLILNSMPEKRKSPEIGSGIVARSVAMGAGLGVESLRQLDHLLKEGGVRRGLGSARQRVASDTTVSRVCGQMEKSWARFALRASWRGAGNQGLLGVELQGQKLRVGVIDGTTLGGFMTSVLAEVGEVPAPICLARIPKRGKELPMSLAMLRHVARAEGAGFLSHVMGDGLYASESFWKSCEAIGACGIVKTDEAGSLLILQDANGIFDASPSLPGVEFTEGVDAVRGCRYKTWAVTDLLWSNTERRLKVARVTETWLKGRYKGQTLTFWVISQDQTLDAVALRELGHRRWFIENNVFRAANEQANTKHRFSCNSRTALVISALQMMGVLWVNAWRHALAFLKDKLKSLWDHGTVPLRRLRAKLWSTLNLAEADTG